MFTKITKIKNITRTILHTKINFLKEQKQMAKITIFQKYSFLLYFQKVIKMDNITNNNETTINAIEEENPTTFLKLKSILDEKQIKYTLMEVIF